MSWPVRIEITSVRDDGGLQYLSGKTQAGEVVKDAIRLQAHGLSTHPPIGSIGLVTFAYGRRDMPAVIGVEHPDKRPRDQQEGGATLYDGSGAGVSVKNGSIEIKPDGSGKILMG